MATATKGVVNSEKASASITITWREALLEAIERIVERYQRTYFTGKELVTEELETIAEQVGCQGATPAQTLKRVDRALRTLREDGLIEFLGKGEYVYVVFDGD